MEIPISTADLVLGDCGSADLEPKFHYMDPYGLCLRPDPTRPDQTRGLRPYMSTLSGQVDNQTADLSKTQAVRWSGLVGSV